MALSNMKVFNQYVMPALIETLAQMVARFNAASAGAIRLTAEGFTGDFLQESFWASVHSAQRRVNRYNTNGDVEAVDLSQLQHNSVKVAGGFGPIRFEPAQMTWLQKPTSEGIEVISRNLAEAMMRDMLNSAIAALVGAIEAQGTATVHDGSTGPVTYRDINQAHAKFGDMSGQIAANVMDGQTFHNLIDANLANVERLFQSQGVRVVDILGRVIVVTDAPALRDTTTVGYERVLGLVPGAAIVHDAGNMVSNIETSNGKDRIETTFQTDYDFGLGLKGYAWDTSKKSPTDLQLATGGNWAKIATSIKHTAGVEAKATY
jgi:hypothetical protein